MKLHIKWKQLLLPLLFVLLISTFLQGCASGTPITFFGMSESESSSILSVTILFVLVVIYVYTRKRR